MKYFSIKFKKFCAQTPSLSRLAVDKLPNLSEPQFSCLYSIDDNNPLNRVVVKDE